MSWFLSLRASFYLPCALISFNFSPSTTHFSSAPFLSFSPLFLFTLRSNIPPWSIRLHKSTAVRSSKKDRNRQQSSIATPSFSLPCTLLLLSLFFFHYTETWTPDPLCKCPHCSEGQTKVVTAAIKSASGSLKAEKSKSLHSRRRKVYKISRRLIEMLLNTNYSAVTNPCGGKDISTQVSICASMWQWAWLHVCNQSLGNTKEAKSWHKKSWNLLGHKLFQVFRL